MSTPPVFVSIPCDFLPYAPIGLRILGPCVTALISLLHMYSHSPCMLLQVVLICFMFQTWYMVSYITCTVIYLVLQSEYQLCSPPTWFTPFDFVPFLSMSPLIPWLALVPPCTGLAKQAPHLVVILPGSPLPCPQLYPSSSPWVET
jgi:hypothetical protein